MCLRGGLAESDARFDQGWKFAGEECDLVKVGSDQDAAKRDGYRKLEDGVGQSGGG